MAATNKRVGAPTPETEHFWNAARRHELALQECVRCKRYFFYPRDHCPFCLGDDVRWRTASGRGTLHTYVIAHQPAPGFESEVPYVIAIVELEEGPRMMANIIGVDADPSLLELDMPVVVEFTEQESLVVPNFRPADVPA